MTPGRSEWSRGSAARLLQGSATRGVLISASRDPDAKLTFVVTGWEGPGRERLAVKIPATPAAGTAVDHEGRMLVEIRRLGLGVLAPTVPRYVESLEVDGRPVLVSSVVPGTPLTIAYHRWPHTRRPSAVRRDFAAAFSWLDRFQTLTGHGEVPVDWPARVLEAVIGRWDGHPALTRAAARLELAGDELAGCTTTCTAVHGDFWFGNVLLDSGSVTGVVDWEAATPHGSPLRDPVRFLLSYSLYLDRHTREGHAVLGHRGLHRTGATPGIEYALCGRGWYPELVRGFLGGRLAALGLAPGLWYAALLTGVGEVAASANADAFGADHLELLARLPTRARRHRG